MTSERSEMEREKKKVGVSVNHSGVWTTMRQHTFVISKPEEGERDCIGFPSVIITTKERKSTRRQFAQNDLLV